MPIKDFDKGDGLSFICSKLNLNPSRSATLVCGDTTSDIPMLTKAVEMFDDVWAVFVTRDEKLKQQVEEICPNSFTVPYPDILLTILGLLSL